MTDFQEQLTTSGLVKPAIPTLTIKNPEDKIQFVNLIELIPSAEFTKKGKIIVSVNGIDEFNNSDKSNAFQNVGLKPIPITNKELRKGSSGKIEFYVWNPTDSNALKINVSARITDDPNQSSSNIIPISQDLVNDIVSESENLITSQQYGDETATALVFTNGMKKMYLVMSSNPSTLLTVDSSDFGNSGEAIDLDQSSPTDYEDYGGADNIVIDYGSIDSRIIGIKFGTVHVSGGGNHVDVLMEYSDDKVGWTTDYTLDQTATGSEVVVSYESASVSFRYVRLTFTLGAGSSQSGTARVYEIYDGDVFGGTASVSLQIKDNSTGNWLDIITASEMGAISQGNDIQKEIGDVATDVTNNRFNKTLPSTQTDLRVKMVIVGNIAIGVSAIYVS